MWIVFGRDVLDRGCRRCPNIGLIKYAAQLILWVLITTQVAWSKTASFPMNWAHRLLAIHIWFSVRIRSGNNRLHLGSIWSPTDLAKCWGNSNSHNQERFTVQDSFSFSLRHINEEYKNPEVIITENGWPDSGQTVDKDRIVYFGEHLKEISKVMREYGCNIRGYTGNDNLSFANE